MDKFSVSLLRAAQAFAAGFVISCSAPAQATQTSEAPTAAPDAEAIVVTGLRDGATILIVDFDKVWRRCAACKVALAKLEKLGEPARQKVAAIKRAQDPFVAIDFKPGPEHDRLPIATGMTPSARNKDRQTKAVRGRFADLYHHDYNELIALRTESKKHIASFLTQLYARVGSIALAENTRRGASAAYYANGKLPKGDFRRIDITDDVIRALDASDFIVELPESTR